MLKLPLFIVYAIVAFNITAFSVILQLDMLIFNALIIKFIVWTLTVGAWSLTYINRDKFVTLF
ncbi:MAG: hypothetical protein R8K20_06710 [Gallionellaceae bacterium]